MSERMELGEHLRGCRVRVVFRCAGETKTVEGTLCDGGKGAIDIRRPNGTVVTIFSRRIASVEALEKTG